MKGKPIQLYNERKNPCTKDCPNRKLRCHGSCKLYKEFDEANKTRRAKNLYRNERIRDLIVVANEGYRRTIQGNY